MENINGVKKQVNENREKITDNSLDILNLEDKTSMLTKDGDGTMFLNDHGEYTTVGSGGQATTLTSTDPRTVVTGSGTYSLQIDTSGIKSETP
jgi:hypothetical protein